MLSIEMDKFVGAGHENGCRFKAMSWLNNVWSKQRPLFFFQFKAHGSLEGFKSVSNFIYILKHQSFLDIS